MKKQITITRALTEIKTLEDRIRKARGSFAGIAVQVGDKLNSPYSDIKPDDFVKKATSTLQKIEDLQNNVIAIKNAINDSNYVTKIKIGDKEMTIAEALVMKTKGLVMKENLLEILRIHYTQRVNDFNKATDKYQAKVDELPKNFPDKKPEEIKQLIELTLKPLEPKLVDPCNLSEYIEKLESEISTFKNNIDYVLSESNSTTYISVEEIED